MTERKVISIDTHREGIARIHENIDASRKALLTVMRLQEPIGSTTLSTLAEDGFITLSELRILASRRGFMEDKKEEIEDKLAEFARFEWNKLALYAQHLLMSSAPEAIPLVLVVGDYFKQGSQDLIEHHPFRTTSPEWQDLFQTAEQVATQGGTVIFPALQASRSLLVTTVSGTSSLPGDVVPEVRNAQRISERILGNPTPVQIARAMLNPASAS